MGVGNGKRIVFADQALQLSVPRQVLLKGVESRGVISFFLPKTPTYASQGNSIRKLASITASATCGHSA